MGMPMVIGVVTDGSIFYYSEYQRLPDSEVDIPRMIAAGYNRMRQISTATLAAILALMPLALGIDAGSDMLKSLAIGVLGALTLSVLLSLFAIPTLYCVMRTLVRRQETIPCAS